MEKKYIIDGNKFIVDNGILHKVILKPETTIIDRFPEGVTSIGASAFLGCTSLEKTEIPTSVTSIGDYAFWGCTSLEKIEIPASVTSIGNNAFYGCKSLKEARILEGVTSIGNHAFYRCESLEKIEIPEGVTSIGDCAFSRCKNLKEARLPEGVTSIGNSAFLGCASLEKIEIPEGVTSIGDNAFYLCASLPKIEIPASVTSIGDNAFWGCTSIEKIKISEGVTSIGTYAFYGCNRLPKIEIPASVTFIEKSVFSGDTKVVFDQFVFKNNKLVADNVYKQFISSYIDSKKVYKDDIQSIINLGIKYNEENYKLFENIDRDKLQYLIDNYNGFFLKYADNISDIIYDNFKYLASQKNLVDMDALKKVYFGFDFEFNFENEEQNKKDFYKKLKEKMNDIDIDLLSTLFMEDKLELRDRLVFVSTMKYLDGDSKDKDIDSAMKMLKRNTFANLTEIDQKLYNKHFDFSNKLIEDDKHFDGIRYHLTKELVSIDPNIIRLFSNNYGPITTQFLESLNTIKNWNNYDDSKKRATYLKNEVTARVLYALARLSAEKAKANNGRFKIDYTIAKGNEEKFLEYICKSNFNEQFKVIEETDKSDASLTSAERREAWLDKICVQKIISSNPYMFDILRGPNKIDSDFYQKAYENGYLFNDEELKVVDQNRPDVDPAEAIALAIINDIGISKIPEENEKEYLDNVNILISDYFREARKDEKKLFSIFRSVDVYLRKNSVDVLEEQKNPKSRDLLEKIFDYDGEEYNNDDRLCYCLYNFNRLAHAIEEINSKIIKIEATKYKTDESFENKIIEDGIGGYNNLQKYGIPVTTINSGIINSEVLTQLVKNHTFYNKVKGVPNEIDKEIKDGKDPNNTLEKAKRRLLSFMSSDDLNPNSLVPMLEEQINSAVSLEELKGIINTFINNNSDKFKENTEKIRNSVSMFVQSGAAKVKNINDTINVTDDDINKIANSIYCIKKLSEKTRDKIRIDAEEQRLFFKAKSLVTIEFLKAMKDYINQKTAEIKEEEKTTIEEKSKVGSQEYKEEFFKEHGYLIEFQKNATGELIVCYNPKFQEPFSVHMKDLSISEENMFQDMSGKDTISYTSVDGGLSEAEKTECDENEVLPNLTAGFMDLKDGVRKAVKVYNFLTYDTVVIKDMIDDFTKTNPSLTEKEIEDFINSKLPITNADTVRFNGDTETIKDKYYRRLKELNETTKKGVSELSEMIEDVEFKEDIEETITTK